ncbi:amidase family protein [Erythrobacter sp. HKB08]|uniref:amidase family protein n=1 Tax=Erythrobacter sp. HKB08 TaxID=2502843 RepID=UPI0010089D87|nr:amidase family protein [Erythrobacter sp. HKB08]
MTFPKLTDEPTALGIAAQVRSGALSPLEAVDAAIARIEALDGPINAVVVRDFDRARDRAKAMVGLDIMDSQPLFGVPMTIKESFDIAGLPTCWGHLQYKDNIATRDSKVVRQLKEAGAVILGKTNVPPDLADWQSTNPVYGRTVNPHDHSRSPGGSSGGSAAAVSSGMSACEFGTDIGGSVRVPAHFCGVWGHKSSWGLVSKHGHDHPAMAGRDAHDGVLSIAGPLARSGADIDVLMRLTATIPIRSTDKPLKECRFLVVMDQPVCPVDGAVRGPIEAAIEAMEAAGLRVDRSSDLLPDLGAQHGHYLRMLNIAMARGMPGPDGRRATATDWFDLLDAQARNEGAWENLFATYDFVLCPPAPVLAVPHHDGQIFQSEIEIDGKMVRAADGLAYAGIATFPNLPSTVLPVGGTGGLPCGMQVIGPRWSDLDCISAARGIAEILGHG